VRGLHFQAPPNAQAKLVGCTRGRIMDIAVDIRVGSPTYGSHVSAELSADEGGQIFIPVGFAHGFVTLEDDTEVSYKVSAPYDPACEAGIFWSDPTLNINWGIDGGAAIISDKDQILPVLDMLESPFKFVGGAIEQSRI